MLVDKKHQRVGPGDLGRHGSHRHVPPQRMPYQTKTLVREALARPFAERRHIFANQIVVGECIAIGRGGLALAVPPKSSDRVRSPASFSVVTKPLSRGESQIRRDAIIE